MPLPQENRSTIEDYYNMPDHIHAELIHGQFYNMAPPNRIHQKISLKLSNMIDSYISEKRGKVNDRELSQVRIFRRDI